MNKNVKESTEYDNFIDKSVATEEEHNPLSDFIEENASFGTDKVNDWRTHWKEMPEYEHDDAKPFKTVYVHFRNQEDYDEFAEKKLVRFSQQKLSLLGIPRWIKMITC